MESDTPPSKRDEPDSVKMPPHPSRTLDAYDSCGKRQTVMYNRSNPNEWMAADYDDVVELRGMR